MASPPFLEVRQVSQSFGRVTALNAVSLVLEPGRIYGLAGENGAGKSTLVKILSGVHTRFQGEVKLDGQPYAPPDAAAAEKAGISVFHQEVPICPNLSVAANVFLGARLPGGRMFPDWQEMERRCHELFREWLDLDIDARRPMRDCTVAECQLALLVRVLSRAARLVILDEPTTALNPPEVVHLFAVIRRLRAQGITFLFVSHYLDELMELSDEIFVLRDSILAGHLERGHYDGQALAQLIAGRTLTQASRPIAPIRDALPRLEVRELSRMDEFQNISFQLRAGEVLGVTGLDGSGRSALARALFGAPPADRGQVFLNGQSVTLETPGNAMCAGIGYVPEDRKALGLFEHLDIQSNLGLLRVDELARFGLVQWRSLRDLALELRESVQIKLSEVDAPITSLSGGNQQKVLIARWLAMRPEVLVMNEPTRGVDVGAKEEICRLVRHLAQEGQSFVVTSSDLDELMQLADRILVLNSGSVTAEFQAGEFSKEALVHAAGRNSTAGTEAHE